MKFIRINQSYGLQNINVLKFIISTFGTFNLLITQQISTFFIFKKCIDKLDISKYVRNLITIQFINLYYLENSLK